LVDVLHRNYEKGDQGSLFIVRDTAGKPVPKRYTKGTNIKPQRLIAAVDALKACGLLEASRPAKRQPEYIRATPRLTALAETTGFDAYAHFSRGESEKVELRRKRKPKGRAAYKSLEDYEENTLTERSRAVIEAWGALLAKEGVTFPNGNRVPSACFTNLRRIFRIRAKENPFETYGRFHGFWQNYHEGERLKMTLGGKPCVEIDIKASIIQTAYALATRKQCPMIDPYTLPFMVANSLANLRPVVKAVAVRLVGIKQGEAAAVKSVRDHLYEEQPEEAALVEAFKVPIEGIVREFLRTHGPFIGDYLLKRKDLYLMFWESQVTLNVIARLTRKGIPCLTTHDSYLCPKENKEEVSKEIKEAFEEVFGIEIEDPSRLLSFSFEGEREIAPLSPASSLLTSGRGTPSLPSRERGRKGVYLHSPNSQ